jgi:hypothetical protein
MTTSEACAGLLEALEANRTDILKSMLDHLAQEADNPLGEVLASRCSSGGTLLHRAVAVDNVDAVR